MSCRLVMFYFLGGQGWFSLSRWLCFYRIMNYFGCVFLIQLVMFDFFLNGQQNDYIK